MAPGGGHFRFLRRLCGSDWPAVSLAAAEELNGLRKEKKQLTIKARLLELKAQALPRPLRGHQALYGDEAPVSALAAPASRPQTARPGNRSVPFTGEMSQQLPGERTSAGTPGLP